MTIACFGILGVDFAKAHSALSRIRVFSLTEYLYTPPKLLSDPKAVGDQFR
jgi:hypothetical protein